MSNVSERIKIWYKSEKRGFGTIPSEILDRM